VDDAAIGHQNGLVAGLLSSASAVVAIPRLVASRMAFHKSQSALVGPDNDRLARRIVERACLSKSQLIRVTAATRSSGRLIDDGEDFVASP
jgi:hypothetical protein